MKVLNLLPIVLLLAFTSQDTFAHTDHDKARFVAVDGVDQGKCDNRFRPCQSIAFAARQANKGDKILVATGEYVFDSAQHAQVLNDSLMPVFGGFSRIDHYQTQNPPINKTTLINVPDYLVTSLYRNGFDTVDFDTVSLEGEQSATQLTNQANTNMAIGDGKSQFLSKDENKYSAPAVQNSIQTNLACENGLAGPYPCNNISLLSHVPVNALSDVSTSANDIWGHVDLNTQREYAIIGMRSGITVVDVTDPQSPSVIGEVNGQSTSWRDIKVYQHFDPQANRWRAYAYASADSVTEGFTIIDLNDLPNSVSLLTRNTDDNRAHNIYISNIDYTFNTPLNNATPQLHLMGQDSNGGAFRSYALQLAQTPSATYIPSALTRDDYAHDASSMLITDARAQNECVNGTSEGCTVILDFNEDVLRLWDHTNASQVEALSATSYNNVAYTHSGWFSEDKQYAFVHDELDERNFSLSTRVLVFDISSLTAPFLAGTWQGDTKTIDHNGYVRGNRYYMSNYERGLTILDISDPTAPEQVGFFDTYPAFNSTSFNGAWGVYPFLPSGNILVSDMQRGLFVLQDNTQLSSPRVAFENTQVNTNSDSTLTLAVNKTGSDAMSVHYEVLSGSATTDDVTLATGQLDWALNDTAPKSIALEIAANSSDESDEIFFVRLYNPQGGGIATGMGYSRVTIDGNAQTGNAEFSVKTLSVLETDSPFTINVNRQAGSEGEMVVHYQLESDTATSGQDVEALSGTLTWLDGDTQAKAITVNLINDNDAEEDEQFTISLSSDNPALLGSFSEVVITIKDDESNQAPIVNAGSDFSALLRTTQTLQGSATDPEGALVSVQWEQTSGTMVTINDSATLVATFTTPNSATTLVFTLTATDEFGVTSSDTITIEVEAPVEVVEVTESRSSGGGSIGFVWLLALIALVGRQNLFYRQSKTTLINTKSPNTEQK
ncbi:MAG: Na-Ca exchanger/integrin-beta4 [Alteromonas sp. Nap_26]|nr:MAG: Na-Ca exchanger/integrin-beta4 [Alteromonas sp. Nap_26]